MKPLAILNGKLVCADGVRAADLLVQDRRIAAIGPFDIPSDAETIDAKGAMVGPGIVDIGVFAIDIPAFAAGGITRAGLMPDQSPPLDNSALVQHAGQAGKPDVWISPIAAATRGLKGDELAELGLMKAAGASAVASCTGCWPTPRHWIWW